MADASTLIGEYAADHQHPVNERLHSLCVPAIAVSLIGLLWCLPVPETIRDVSPWLNWATGFLVAALVYYFRLSVRLGLGMVVVSVVAVAIVLALDRLPGPLWLACVTVFVIAWIGQFVGHGVEGKRPSFFRDLRFLLIGPLWLLAGLYGKLGIRV
jgi:uncharacterized membrane protein YGL010W